MLIHYTIMLIQLTYIYLVAIHYTIGSLRNIYARLNQWLLAPMACGLACWETNLNLDI